MDGSGRVAKLLAVRYEEQRFRLIAEFVTDEPASARLEAEGLLGAADASARTLGADLLGQLSTVGYPDVAGIVDILLPRLGVEMDADALSSVIVALGHTQDERAEAPVVAFADHDSASVRAAVAFALPLHTSDERVVTALRQLTADTDDVVRDWATFGLANSRATDEATIAALIARSDDSDYDTRCEAILGLARRHHPRAQALVDRELARTRVGALIEEARDILANDAIT